MEGRIAIPLHNVKGEVMAYAGRFPGEPPEGTAKYKLPPGFKKSQELFNCDRAFKESPDKPLLIVEGFFDCMKIHDHGYKKVVALMGASMSPTQEELIRKHTIVNSQAIIMLDENEAGITGREDIAVRLSKFCFVRVHQFPRPDMEPEQLTDNELADIVEGVV
jgi:DNA primase